MTRRQRQWVERAKAAVGEVGSVEDGLLGLMRWLATVLRPENPCPPHMRVADVLDSGVSWCDQQCKVYLWLARALFGVEGREVALAHADGRNFHTVVEVRYDGAWHLLDVATEHQAVYRHPETGAIMDYLAACRHPAVVEAEAHWWRGGNGESKAGFYADATMEANPAVAFRGPGAAFYDFDDDSDTRRRATAGRIAVLYTGFTCSTRVCAHADVPDDIAALPSTHMSEVNHLLVAHYLERIGHEVVTVVDQRPSERAHFRQVHVDDLDPSAFDWLLLWKSHGLVRAAAHDLLARDWDRVVVWCDSLGGPALLGAAAARVDAWAWGTEEVRAAEHGALSGARHAAIEHATVFPDRPRVGPAEPRGLYLGRLPGAYLDPVRLAAGTASVRAFALWIGDGADRILLRPGQFAPADLARAREAAGPVDLHPAVNVVAQAEDLSRSAFGLCPATSEAPQAHSASKFFDYAALGLPTVLADNTPEARHVAAYDVLGELYRQGDAASLERAIRRCIERAASPEFPAQRAAIQEWMFRGHTYRHRADALDRFIR